MNSVPWGSLSTRGAEVVAGMTPIKLLLKKRRSNYKETVAEKLEMKKITLET